jgi:hypothetical protein
MKENLCDYYYGPKPIAFTPEVGKEIFTNMSETKKAIYFDEWIDKLVEMGRNDPHLLWYPYVPSQRVNKDEIKKELKQNWIPLYKDFLETYHVCSSDAYIVVLTKEEIDNYFKKGWIRDFTLFGIRKVDKVSKKEEIEWLFGIAVESDIKRNVITLNYYSRVLDRAKLDVFGGFYDVLKGNKKRLEEGKLFELDGTTGVFPLEKINLNS